MSKLKLSKDKKILYIASALLFAVLTFSLFIPGGSIRLVAAAMLIPLLVFITLAVKKRAIPSINKSQVLIVISLIALVYLMLLYLSGLTVGFMRATVPTSLKSIFKFVIPIAFIIVATEISRWIMLAQEDKAATVLVTASCVISELVISAGLFGIMTYSRFMDLLGMAFIPAVTANVTLYSYLAKRHGPLPAIVYRLVLSLYPYLIPFEPRVEDALLSFTRLILPILSYLFVRMLYEKTRKKALRKRSQKASLIATAVAAVLMALFVMLISCQFHFGVLVIATNSMKGEFERGDAVVFEKYEGEIVKEGEIIVFDDNGANIVHRIVRIERVNGQNRYYTKGDANDSEDYGYVTENKIKGVLRFKVKGVGYPTLWMQSLFD